MCQYKVCRLFFFLGLATLLPAPLVARVLQLVTSALRHLRFFVYIFYLGSKQMNHISLEQCSHKYFLNSNSPSTLYNVYLIMATAFLSGHLKANKFYSLQITVIQFKHFLLKEGGSQIESC